MSDEVTENVADETPEVEETETHIVYVKDGEQVRVPLSKYLDDERNGRL